MAPTMAMRPELALMAAAPLGSGGALSPPVGVVEELSVDTGGGARGVLEVLAERLSSVSVTFSEVELTALDYSRRC